MPYYPDFGEELHIWIETDHPTQYRDRGDQMTRPALQSQLTAIVDIPPQTDSLCLVTKYLAKHTHRSLDLVMSILAKVRMALCYPDSSTNNVKD